MELSLATGKSKTEIREFAGLGSDNVLHNPNGIEVGYGYDTNKENGGRLRVFYGGKQNSNEIIYAGRDRSFGTHNINLSRPLVEGESIFINWKNGTGLKIYCERENTKLKTKVKKICGGSYGEIGKWASENRESENTSLLFDDDMNTKRFDKIETVFFKEII